MSQGKRGWFYLAQILKDLNQPFFSPSQLPKTALTGHFNFRSSRAAKGAMISPAWMTREQSTWLNRLIALLMAIKLSCESDIRPIMIYYSSALILCQPGASELIAREEKTRKFSKAQAVFRQVAAIGLS